MKGAGGFTRGTPVHTEGGVRPIEQVRQGDLVLSTSPTAAGEMVLIRVVRVLELGKGTIRKINTYADEPGTQYFLAAQDDQPFWVDEGGWGDAPGWKPASQLGRHTRLRGIGGAPVLIDAQFPVYRTGEPGIGWVQQLSDVEGSYGGCFDYENWDLAPPTANAEYLPPGILRSADPFLTVTLLHLEVEGHHTFFVGYDGILVADVMISQRLSSIT